MATFNGTKLGIYIGDEGDPTETWELIAAATDCSLSLSAEVIDVSTKDSGAWRQLLAGMRSASMSTSGLIDYTASNKNLSDLFAAFNSRTRLHLRFSNAVSGDQRYECYGYLTSLEQSAGMEDTATYSASLEIDGAVTAATN